MIGRQRRGEEEEDDSRLPYVREPAVVKISFEEIKKIFEKALAEVKKAEEEDDEE